MLAMLADSLKAKVVAADYKWDKLPEEVVCSMDIYGIIGTYLGSHYRIYSRRKQGQNSRSEDCTRCFWGHHPAVRAEVVVEVQC